MTDTVDAGRPGSGRLAPPEAGHETWDRVFRPRSVAVLGASGRQGSLMARPSRWLVDRGFAGVVHLVNPKYDQLAGRPCHPSLAAVPGPIDLVLALVPAAQAVDAVREAGEVGAAAVVVFASGFAETGPRGAALQQQLIEAGRRAGVRVIGPNCQGIYYAPTRLFATFTGAAERPLTGSCGIAYIGQSGAVGGSVLDLAAESGLDLTAWVSTGNQADADLTEIGRYLVSDAEVSVLMVYAESVRDGAAYEELAAAAADAGTGLVVLRSGRSAAGRRAVVSHTGAMLGDDTALRLVSERHGVVLVDDVEELLAAADLLRGRRRPEGRRIAAVTTSGGAGILAADQCERYGLTLPELTSGTQARLAELVPEFGALANPVDVTAQLFNRSDRAFGEVCSIVCADERVDALMVIITMVIGDAAADLATDLAASVDASGVPCSVVWLAGRDQTVDARAILRASGIPVLPSIGLAARVAAALAPPAELAASQRSPGPPSVTGPFPLPDDLPGADLPAADAGWALLDALGVRHAGGRHTTTAPDATEAARDLGGRVAMKVVAPGVAHKADIGGVRLDVAAAEAAGVFAELTGLVPEQDGVLVQPMLPAGFELLVGADGGHDGWPPVLTVGLGGTGTEVHRDLVTSLAPVTPEAALAMLRRLRSWPLLAGHRGAPGCDVEAAVDVVVRVGLAIARWTALAELEINPLIVGPAGSGAVAVDVLVATRTTGPPTPARS